MDIFHKLDHPLRDNRAALDAEGFEQRFEDGPDFLTRSKSRQDREGHGQEWDQGQKSCIYQALGLQIEHTALEFFKQQDTKASAADLDTCKSSQGSDIRYPQIFKVQI